MQVYFVHGRPAGHPMHAKYGHSIRAKFQFEDPWFRWHDKNYPSIIRYVAWIINSFAFIKVKKTIIVTEGLRLTVVLGKLLSFGKLTLVALVDDESPYFIDSGFYSKISTRINTWAYRQYDACICIGEMETSLIKKISAKKTYIATGINGIAKQLHSQLTLHEYNTKSTRIVFIGNGPAQWRAWYKGLDLMLSVFCELVDQWDGLTFEIAGNWDIETLCKGIPPNKKERIKFVGKINDVSEFLKDASLYLHTARGEAWGISINEAMAAGAVPIVSEWTGAKEMVEQVDTNLIVKLNKEVIVARINWFLNLPDSTRQELSDRCKQVSAAYTDEVAIRRFQENFQRVTTELALSK